MLKGQILPLSGYDFTMFGYEQFVVPAEDIGNLMAVIVHEGPFLVGEGGDVVQRLAVLLDAGEDGFQVVEHELDILNGFGLYLLNCQSKLRFFVQQGGGGACYFSGEGRGFILTLKTWLILSRSCKLRPAGGLPGAGIYKVSPLHSSSSKSNFDQSKYWIFVSSSSISSSPSLSL